MAQNGIMFQYFEWYMENLENNLWIRLKEDAQHLQDLGITSVWIPPVSKGTSPFDTGYGTYDLYDLGEQMHIGSNHQGAVYADYTGNRIDKVTIDMDGKGIFPCNAGQVSVWVRDQVAPEVS